MRVPHFWLFTLGLSAILAIFGCSRESSVKENVNLKNNHSRVFAFKDPIPDPQAFADSMANTAVMEADTIPDTLTVTVNDSVYLIAVLPYFTEKIYRFQWTFTNKDGKDTVVIGDNAKPEVWAYAKPGLYEPKFVAFDGNNATDTAGTATRKAWIKVIDTKPILIVPKDTLWTKHDGDITFPILASDSFGTITSIKVDLDASGKKDSAKTWKYQQYEDNDSLYLTIKNKEAIIDSLGNQKIYVFVTDDDGNETKDSVNLHFNRIPRLKVIYPQDDARHNINDRFYFYYEGEDDDNPQDLQYFIYAQETKNGQPPQKAFTEDDLIAKAFTSNIFEPIDKNGKNVITLVNHSDSSLTGRIYWDMYATDGYDIVRLTRISTGENSSRPWSFYIGDLTSSQGTFTGFVKYQGRDVHSGIRIEFSNGNKTFDAVTNENGKYTVKVDAGTYTTTVISDSLREYQSFTLKDGDTEKKFLVEAGGLIRMDEIVLKDTVPPMLLVKNIDTLTTRAFNQTVYARDLGAGIDTVTASIDGEAKPLTCSIGEEGAIYNCALSLNNLLDGDHKFIYTAKDKAGNIEKLEQTITIKATKIAVDVNGDKNARIGEGETLIFTAEISDAIPAPKKVTWSWDLDDSKKTADVDENGKATITYTYDQLKDLATAGKEYLMTVSYTENGADVKAQVKFGIRGDDPSIIFTEPAFDDTVSLNDVVAFKVKSYLGKASTSLIIKWSCTNSDKLAAGYACPADDTEEANIAYKDVGTYTITVTATDQDGKFGTASTKIIVISDPPTIDVTTESKTNEYKINSIVTVKASVSDKFGAINKIEWGCSNGMVSYDYKKDIDPPTAAISDIALQLTLPGAEVNNHRCIFRATDDDGEQGYDTLIFKTLLDPPTIRLNTKRDTVKVNSQQTIKAIANDKLGYIAKYENACSENLNDLKNPAWEDMSSAQTTVIMPQTAVNAYYCVVQVTDDDGNTARDTAIYKVVVGMPSVTAYVNHNRVTIKDTVELNAHAQDSLGTLVKYEWGCGAASAENIGFTYSSATSPRTTMVMPSIPQNGYKCIARVTDDDGNIAKDTVTIDIILAPPSIEVTKDTLTVREGYNITLNAEAYDNNNLPSDPGSIVKREWSCGTQDEIVNNWKTVSDFDTVWKAPAAEAKFYCVARATDNDGNMVTDTMKIGFSTEIPLIWVSSKQIFINEGDGFTLDASVNSVWQGIDWFTWDCKDTTGKSLESKVTKYDYAANGKTFRVYKDSTYSEHGKNMNCIVSAQETSTGVTFSDTTHVVLIEHHPIGVISAADTVYLWSGDESLDDEAIYFYTPDWHGKNSKLGDLGNASQQDYWWRFSNVDANFYQGKKDGSLDTSIAQFNTAFIRKTTEGSMTIYLDYRDSTTTSPTQSFYHRHRAEEVSRKVYFSKAWRNQGPDTVIAKSTSNTPSVMTLVTDAPTVAYHDNNANRIVVTQLQGNNWNNVGTITLTHSVSSIQLVADGSTIYVGVLDTLNKFSVYKSFTQIGNAIEGVTQAKILVKSGATNAVVMYLKNNSVYLAELSGGTWKNNSTFNRLKNNVNNTTVNYREFDALFASNGSLVIIAVDNTSDYTGYKFVYNSSYQFAQGDKIDKFMSKIALAEKSNTLYIGFANRDIENGKYGPYLYKGTISNNSLSIDKSGVYSKSIHEGLIAYNISLAISGNTLYAAMDDAGRTNLSQVHVYRLEGNKWHLHGENQLPYFSSVFYNKNKYYLRGSTPTVATSSNGKVYVSMTAREAAYESSHNAKNNGPLVMKYVADNWEIK